MILRLVLPLLLAAATPAQQRFLPYDFQLPVGCTATVVPWNGVPSLLITGNLSNEVARFAPQGWGVTQALALDVQAAFVADSRPCNGGTSWGVGSWDYGWLASGSLGWQLPAGGVDLRVGPLATLQFWNCGSLCTMGGAPFAIDYCQSGGRCVSGCNGPGVYSHDRPQFVAIIATVRLL